MDPNQAYYHYIIPLLIKAKKGIEPLLQILQTYTLPLCYLTCFINIRKFWTQWDRTHTLYLQNICSTKLELWALYTQWELNSRFYLERVTSWPIERWMCIFNINKMAKEGVEPSTTTYETDKLPYSTSPFHKIL